MDLLYFEIILFFFLILFLIIISKYLSGQLIILKNNTYKKLKQKQRQGETIEQTISRIAKGGLNNN